MFSLRAAIVLLVISSRSFAAESADSEITERTRFIEKHFVAEKSAAQLWWWGWLGGYSALEATQIVLYNTLPHKTEDDKVVRDSLLVGSFMAPLGILGQFLNPMPATYAATELAAMPEATAEERRKKFLRAEALLNQSSDNERLGTSWLAHTAAAIVNAAGAIVIWKGMNHQFTDGLANFLVGSLIAEMQIFTQPTRSIEVAEAYRRRYGSAQAAHNSPFFIQVGLTGFRAGIYF